MLEYLAKIEVLVYLSPSLVYASCEGCGKYAQMGRLDRAFATRICADLPELSMLAYAICKKNSALGNIYFNCLLALLYSLVGVPRSHGSTR